MDLSKLQEMVKYAEKKAMEMIVIKENIELEKISNVSFDYHEVSVEVHPNDYLEDNFNSWITYEELNMDIIDFKNKIESQRRQAEQARIEAEKEAERQKVEQEKLKAQEAEQAERELYENLKAKFEPKQ